MGGFPSLKEMLEAFTASGPVAAAITLGSALVLYLHSIKTPYVRDLPEIATTVIVVAAIYGAIVWLIRILQGLSGTIGRWWRMKKLRGRIRTELSSLADDEEMRLYEFVALNEKTFVASLLDNTIAKLVARGLVERHQGSFSARDWPHSIIDEVWIELKLREFFSSPTVPPRLGNDPSGSRL